MDAADLRNALRATAAHRRVALRPLSATVGRLADRRADGYTAYRRRLATDADHLPLTLRDLIGAVIAFADPVLDGTVPSASRWNSATRTWR